MRPVTKIRRFLCVCCLVRSITPGGGGLLLLPGSPREGQERSSTLHKDRLLKSHKNHCYQNTIIICITNDNIEARRHDNKQRKN